MLELNLHPFTPLHTERLLIRQLTFNDTQEIFALRSNKEAMAFIDRPLDESPDDSRLRIQKINESFETNDSITWGITLNGENIVVGTIGYWRIDKEHHRGEIGYMLHPRMQGKGIMQEAITAVIRYGFDAMQLHSIEANVHPGNQASIKLLERNRFVREGYFRENFYANGRFTDTAVYSLIATS
jgi:[ribosomal protein S5]-alanine N-acetyltransferase